MDSLADLENLAMFNDEEEALLPGILLADSDISDLDISSNDVGRRSLPPPTTPRSAKILPKPRLSRQSQITERRRGEPHHQETLHRPSYCKEPAQRLSHRNEAARRSSPNISEPRRPADPGWDADVEYIDAHRLPREPDESQQDLAAHIDSLTRAIHENAQFCLEISGKMINIAKENKHLYYVAGSTLSTYVLQPCLKAGSALCTYFNTSDGLQALRDYEAHLRRAVSNCANGREMALIGTAVQDSSKKQAEVSRLKDRLVEQDALLRDTSQHVQKLMRERDLLKIRLAGKKEGLKEASQWLGSRMDREGNALLAASNYVHDGREEDVQSGKVGTALNDALRELRVFAENLTLREAITREKQDSATESRSPGVDFNDEKDDENEWTLL